MKKNEILVKLLITNFTCSFEEISKILDLNPSGIWREGDLIQNTSLKRKQNGWFLEPTTGLTNGSINDQSESIFRNIGSKIKNFKNLPSNSEIELNCCMYIYDRNIIPEIHLTSKIVKNIALINSNFDLDLYYFTQIEKK